MTRAARGMATSADLPEIELAVPALAIADLHLDATDAAAVAPFVRWLGDLGAVRTLAILGDLFDVWVGPSQATMPGAAAVLASLAGARARGTRVLVVPGNRDFLLGRAFELLSGAEILTEGFVAAVGARRAPSRILCVHGDTLCTRDRGYQRLRRVLRSRAVLAVAPLVPRPLGLAVARRLRRASVRAIAAKPAEEKSIQRDAVVAAAGAARADVVVCGHAHAFRDETLDGGTRWIVLDAFGGPRDVLRVEPDGRFEPRSSSATS